MEITTKDRRADDPPAQYLTVSLDGALFAIGILRIVEIIEFREPTGVPMMPAFVRGVLNLRGVALPVVDLRARFGRGPTAVSRKTCVVVVQLRAPEDECAQGIGLMVDQVNAVVEIAPRDVQEAPSWGGLRADFLSGLGQLDGRFVAILDLDKMLSCQQLAALSPPDLDAEDRADAPV